MERPWMGKHECLHMFASLYLCVCLCVCVCVCVFVCLFVSVCVLVCVSLCVVDQFNQYVYVLCVLVIVGGI